MRRLPVILLALGLIGLGCKSTDKKPPAPNNSTGPNKAAPFFPEDRPPAATGGRESPPHEKDGMLAGRLIDSNGKPLPSALVNVTATDAGPNAKPIGVQADDQGYFMIKGLNSGTKYSLSVRSSDNGRSLGGSATAEAPNIRLLIHLSEGEGSPVTPVAAPAPAPAAAPDKKDNKSKLTDPTHSNAPKPDPIPPAKGTTSGADQSWGPGKTAPVIAPAPPPPSPNNPNIAVDSNRPSPPPTLKINNGPGSAPAQADPPPPPPPASSGMSAVPSNSSPLTGAAIQNAPRINFTLYDAGHNPVEFRNLSDRRLIVLDFWSTTCMPCLRKIPDLIDLQSRYSNYVEIAGVACDNLAWPDRKKAVDGIKDYYLRKAQKPINYGIWFEGDGQEGRVQTQFKVKAYPTMVLLDHAGRELWRGSDVHQLDDAIKYYLMRK